MVMYDEVDGFGHGACEEYLRYLEARRCHRRVQGIGKSRLYTQWRKHLFLEL